MNILTVKAFAGLLFLLLAMAALVFVPAGTFRYWQAWTFLAVYFASSLALTLYLLKEDPELLQRRMRGGPTVEKEPVQKVICTGPYALVRHPMYSGALVMLLGIPIALGSWWGVLVVAAILPALIWRLFEEEKFLARNLAGYVEYRNGAKFRLIPMVW